MSAIERGGGQVSKFKSIVGQVFGRLTVLQQTKAERCFCRCDCGVEREFLSGNVRSGKSRSCGCLSRDMASANNGTHRMSGTPEHKAWKLLRDRCNRKGHPKAHRYSDRGIVVCERWDSFENFYTDMGPRPSKHHSIDRINNDGNYEPSNCRWATAKQQGRNTSRTIYVEFEGALTTLAELTERFTVDYERTRRRVRSGWSIQDALSKAPRVGGYRRAA